jgi:fermentation-respiration switch protein FrsA (DUF1100 family)
MNVKCSRASVSSAVKNLNQEKRSSGARRGWRIVRPAIVAYLIVVLGLMLFERYLVYPVPPLARGDWHPRGLGHEDVTFHSADGTKLHGWYVPHPQARRAILYCHGNGEQVADNADLVALLRDKLQASIFIFDYRGYGYSEGRPDEAGCIADGRAAQAWLAGKMGIRPDQIVLMGRSLGAGVAVALASESGAAALILENAFPSLTDVAAALYWWLPVRWAMDNRFDSISRIHKYQGPLFQCHGAADQLVPITMGRQLFDAAPTTQKQFLEFPNFGHNDAWPASYYDKLAAFLDQRCMDQL